MAIKTKKLEEHITLAVDAPKVVSYADYFARKPLFPSLKVSNGLGEAVEGLTLSVTNENGLLAACVKELGELPFESTVEMEPLFVLSPAYFTSLESSREEKILVEIKKDKKTVTSEEITVLALPFDEWEGLHGNLETLASFIRPKLAEPAKLATEVAAQLKKWEVSAELGYEGNDKNAVRRRIAALFACIRRYALTKEERAWVDPVSVGAGTRLLTERKATPVELALLVCATLERMELHPVLAIGEKEIACGVWLYDSCFLDAVSDDSERIAQYVSSGINNLSFFDLTDLFSTANAAYSTSENHFVCKLQAGAYERFLDIRRSRIARVLPLPLKERGAKGVALLKEEEFSFDAAPSDLTLRKKLSLDSKQTKNKQWERRLLDLSMKNALLSFRPEKGGVRLASASIDETLGAFLEKGEITLLPAVGELEKLAKEKEFGLSAKISSLRELIALEFSGGHARAVLPASELSEAANRLVRKGKEADEESGTKILYLAFGFLKWTSKERGEENYAPLVLLPVSLKKARYASEYTVQVSDDELSVNSTLLEFLKQEFDVDVRGLDGALQGLKISEILAMVRMEVAQMKGWKVTDDVYLSAFSFARYQMWQDVRKNMEEFSKNKLVSSLLNNRSELESLEGEEVDEDAARVTTTLLPLTADSSQYEAIALSQTGKSFVLHGPPGTGKSQTITNIIANALNDGKRVLFVAEKQAALSVVKKRLDSLGLGDFCLELHSGKTAKSEVLQKLTTTLALAGSGEQCYLGDQAEKIERLRAELAAPIAALYKKRRLGVSVYEAMLACLKYKNAPDIMNIESAFYDGLTKEKIARYEELTVQAAAAAKECGGVHNSPFANVNLLEYSPELKDAVYCAAEVVVAEIKHLKNYIALFLELYRQRMSAFTRKKLNGLFAVAKKLDDGSLNKYFFEKEEELIAFYNANRRLDGALESYFKVFKKLIKVDGGEIAALSAWLEKENADYEGEKTVKGLVKRLRRESKEPLEEGKIFKALETLSEIYGAMKIIESNTSLADNFKGAFGKVDYFKGRKIFLEELYELHDTCATLFMDYNADSFNSMCIRAANGYASPVLKGLTSAVESFRAAENGFLQITNADRTLVPEEDIFEYYNLKAGALIDNLDMLASWCAYKKTAQTLDKEGLRFITDALENGSVTGENIIGSFEKNIYKNFLQTNLPLDPALAKFSAAVTEENTEALRRALDEFARMAKNNIRYNLISRLPTPTTEGPLALELVAFLRLAKTNLRGMGVRRLFEEIPELVKTLAPCMLMSPMTVSQYLAPENGMFDLVIFDEASQMPTAEAVASLARAKAAIIVGDPKQLPPTGFFTANYIDEENLENEDMESVLDDCLALGLPERRLSWHYRSKHESLIAFSNLMYYGNKLCTFPSPDSLCSKVRFELVTDGVYDRGFTKRNKGEADALVKEVVARLSDEKRKSSSIGIVTFSSVQKDYIERRLAQEIHERRLEEAAYEREEPLFVKNLENVQGDERDVILFSVCYGPDKFGRVSLNFGPLNQAGGWRRLNVAVSRAREEMVVFSSMTGAMIDGSKTASKGVLGLKAFLEFAQKGRTTLAIPSGSVHSKKTGLGKYIAAELAAYGYDCRADVGVSDFKIDVAVVDPKNKQRFILAVLCDSGAQGTVKDRNVLQIQTLKRNNWNVARVFAVNYYNNPKREIKKIKDLLDKLTGADKKGGTGLSRAKKNYKYAALEGRIELSQFVLSGENDGEICARLKAIVAAEEPISYPFLVKRCLGSLGINKWGSKVETRMRALVGVCGFKAERIFGEEYYRKTDKTANFDKYRVETGDAIRKTESDFTPYEVIAIVRGALEDKVALYVDELVTIAASIFKIPRPSERFALFINDCISLGEERGYFVRSVSDRISMA